MDEFAQDQSTSNAVNGNSTIIHRDQATLNKNGGGYMKLDGEAHQSTYLLLGRHDPCSPLCTFVAPRANLMSTVRGAAQQIECETITIDTALTDSERPFLADELLSAESLGATSDHCTCTSLQDYNLNGIFDSLKPTSPVLATQVQNKSLELEGRSVPGDHDNALLKPAIMNRTSRFGWLGRRKVSDAHELGESMVFRRKFLLKEHSEAYPRVSPSSTVLNFDTDGVDIYGTSRGNEIDEDEFRHGQGTGQLPESYLENVIQLYSHINTMTNLGIEIEAESGSVVQYEQQKSSEDVGGRCAFAGNDANLHERGEEVLMKNMGWITFPVEYPNEDNDTALSLRWILDELPSASDLPHLESLMEISPSKFWSPISESSKRPPVQFGYLNPSASPQSSHSIQYFLNDSPASSPELKRTILGGASGVRIASKESNRRCSREYRNTHGTTQRTLTPRPASGESMETGMKSTPSGSDRTSSISSSRFSSPLHQDHIHHRETGSAANLTQSDTAARRLQNSHLGKNLVMDFLEVGRTQDNIEAKRITNGIPRKDTTVPSSGTLWTQNENTSDQMRLQCLTGHSSKESESALPSLELQIVRGVDGNWLTKRAYECHQNCTRKKNDPLVPLSDISNHPNLATSLRNSLHEKIESQLLYRKPLPESVSDERLVTFQCPEPTPENFACSTPTVPRVSRKRSRRITTPKLTRLDVLNLFGTGKVGQPVRTTPDKDFYPCKRRKTTRKRSEVSTYQRDVNVQSTTAGDCEIDLKERVLQGGTSTTKLPTLSRIIKPLRLLKSSPAKGYICVPRKLSLRSTVRKRLPSDLRNVNATHSAKSAPIKHPNDESEVVAMKNLGSSVSAIRRQKVKDDCLQTLPAGSEMSIGIIRSSKYRGVTRHRHTGRYEAHLWDNTKVKLGLAKRGRQVYLGAYPDEDDAAQAHDLAALKYWGSDVYTNFELSLYEEELKTMKNLTKEEYIVILRRRSPGFTRGVSKYRGVTRHHQEGRWEARIGRHSGAKYHYLGTYDTQEEAAAAYDRAAVRNRGVNAVTNFDISNYIKTKSKAHRTVSPSSSSSGESE